MDLEQQSFSSNADLIKSHYYVEYANLGLLIGSHGHIPFFQKKKKKRKIFKNTKKKGSRLHVCMAVLIIKDKVTA